MKVLMVTMGMDIGGAETHIVELSSALVSRGIEVTVASAGGVFEDTLRQKGIGHITLPLHKKSPLALLRSYRGLKKAILAGGYDIVHAHARIPAFLCGCLQKRLGFRFVTTAHGAFRVNPFLKRMSCWGEQTFAVSEDIKNYLIQNYKVPPERITLTVNGINTDIFATSEETSASRHGLGLPNTPILLHVSRLDKKSSLCAEALMDAVELLDREVTLVIVGGGSYERTLREKAESLNRRLERRAVIITGAKPDVADYIAMADIFVGPSRAAMEALSCGKPVIVSGSEGHGGIFDESLLEEAVASNFCFRGYALPIPERLAKDITTLFEMSEGDKNHLSAYGRTIIKKRYSVERMTESQLTVYRTIAPYRTKGSADVLICGYYGYGNAGDESMLSAIVDGMRRIDPTLCLCVMSAHPAQTKKRYLTDAVWRFDLFAAQKKMKESKLFLFGGGNLLQDRTSTKSLIYYTEMLRLAKKCGKKVMIYANGIGPIDNPKNLSRIRTALSCCDSISLRDQASFGLCKVLFPDKNIRLTFDPAITAVCIENAEKQGYFTVIPKKSTGEVLEKLVFVISQVRISCGLTPRILCLYDGEDLPFCRRIADKTGATLLFGLTEQEMLRTLSDSALVLSARLHGLVYATVACSPMMSFSDDGKLSAYLDQFGFGRESTLPAVTYPDDAGKVLVKIAEGLLSHREGIANKFALLLPTLRAMAEYEFNEAVRAVREDTI